MKPWSHIPTPFWCRYCRRYRDALGSQVRRIEVVTEQPREQEMVIWRCPECGWYWADGDTVEDDASFTCDRTLNPAEYPNCGKMQRTPVLPASAVAGLERENRRLRGIMDDVYRSLTVGRTEEAIEYLRSASLQPKGAEDE